MSMWWSESHDFYFAHVSGCKVLWWACLSVCVCVFVCLFARIFQEPYVRSLPNVLCTFLMAVARSSSSRVTKSQGEGAFFPIESALYSIAFGTHTKTAEPIEMPCGMIRGLGLRNNFLSGADNPRRGRGNFGEKMCLTSLILLMEVGVGLHTVDEILYLWLPCYICYSFWACTNFLQCVFAT